MKGPFCNIKIHGQLQIKNGKKQKKSYFRLLPDILPFLADLEHSGFFSSTWLTEQDQSYEDNL